MIANETTVATSPTRRKIPSRSDMASEMRKIAKAGIQLPNGMGRVTAVPRMSAMSPRTRSAATLEGNGQNRGLISLSSRNRCGMSLSVMRLKCVALIDLSNMRRGSQTVGARFRDQLRDLVQRLDA